MPLEVQLVVKQQKNNVTKRQETNREYPTKGRDNRIMDKVEQTATLHNQIMISPSSMIKGPHRIRVQGVGSRDKIT